MISKYFMLINIFLFLFFIGIGIYVLVLLIRLMQNANKALSIYISKNDLNR